MSNKQQTFTRQQVINLINQLLSSPDILMDAITNEHTNYDGGDLLEQAEALELKYPTNE